MGTTQTQDFLPFQACLQVLQQYLYLFFLSLLTSPLLLERSEELRLLLIKLVVIQIYNKMLQMNNIRFNYVQKDRNFANSDNPNMEKQGVGRLLRKDQKNRPYDDQEQRQIAKKKTLYQGNSLNYSQIYSDIRINRNEKIQPKMQNRHEQSKHINHSSNIPAYNKQESLDEARSLPKIAKNSRAASHFTPNQKDFNATQNDLPVQKDSKSHFARAKGFSISHYDIYRPGFLVHRKSGLSAQKEVKVEGNILEVEREQNKSIVQSQFQAELDKQLPQQPIKISFQNQSDQDLPQNIVGELESSKNLSKQARASKTQAYKSRAQPQKKIQEQTIQVQISKSNAKRLKQSSINHEKVEQVQKILKEPKLEKRIKQCTHLEVNLKNNNMHQESKQITQSDSQKNYQKQSDAPFKEIKLKEIAQAKLFEADKPKQGNTAYKLQKNQRETFLIQKQKQKELKEQNEQKKEQIKQKQKIGEKEEKLQFINSVSKSNEEQNNQYLTNQKLIKEQSYRPYEYNKFSVVDYMKIYEILKNIHSFLKNPVLDTHNLIKQIKRYLETVACGSLDHIQGYEMPLHRLKIVKNALLFERISIVIVSFAYCVGKIKESLKFIINLVSYAINNTLLILRILENSDLTKEAAKNPIMAKSDRLVIKKNYDTVRNNNDIILDSIFKISKYQQVFSQSFKDILKSVGKSSLEQTFYNVLQYFAFFLCVSELHMSLPFLAVAPNPYLRQTLDKRPTLIIDIVQIFCHGTRKSKSHVFRPHTQHFLNEMSQFYEIVSFTCAYPNQIDKVIDILDSKKHIKHRLYRHHAMWKNSILYKQTERIGRDLNRLILLDSFTNAIKGQSNNTIMIPIWRGNKNDTTLAQLCPILAAIAIKNLNCQQATRKIHQQQIKNENAGIKYLNFGINLE